MYTAPLELNDADCEQNRADHVAELKKANQKLEDFVHIASHDLRAPLRAMMSLVDWVREDLESTFGTLPESIGADLSELSAQGQRMSRLLQDLLEFTQVDADAEIDIEFDRRALIEDCLEICAVPAAFNVTLAEELPAVRCSHTEFTLVMRNLISNSVKYHDRAEGTIAVDGWVHQGFGYFRVRDDGPGVEAKFAGQIFDMFRTLDSRRGSGIGLGLVKKVTEKYGGMATYEPNPLGRGSDFIVSFPLGKAWQPRPGGAS